MPSHHCAFSIRYETVTGTSKDDRSRRCYPISVLALRSVCDFYCRQLPDLSFCNLTSLLTQSSLPEIPFQTKPPPLTSPPSSSSVHWHNRHCQRSPCPFIPPAYKSKATIFPLRIWHIAYLSCSIPIVRVPHSSHTAPPSRAPLGGGHWQQPGAGVRHSARAGSQ